MWLFSWPACYETRPKSSFVKHYLFWAAKNLCPGPCDTSVMNEFQRSARKINWPFIESKRKGWRQRWKKNKNPASLGMSAVFGCCFFFTNEKVKQRLLAFCDTAATKSTRAERWGGGAPPGWEVSSCSLVPPLQACHRPPRWKGRMTSLASVGQAANHVRRRVTLPLTATGSSGLKSITHNVGFYKPGRRCYGRAAQAWDWWYTGCLRSDGTFPELQLRPSNCDWSSCTRKSCHFLLNTKTNVAGAPNKVCQFVLGCDSLSSLWTTSEFRMWRWNVEIQNARKPDLMPLFLNTAGEETYFSTYNRHCFSYTKFSPRFAQQIKSHEEKLQQTMQSKKKKKGNLPADIRTVKQGFSQKSTWLEVSQKLFQNLQLQRPRTDVLYGRKSQTAQKELHW